MADILAALAELEGQNKPKPTNMKFVNPLTNQQSRNSHRTGRSQSRQSNRSNGPRPTTNSRRTSRADSPHNAKRAPPNTSSDNFLSPNKSVEDTSSYQPGDRSPSVASGRRISFAARALPPVVQRRLRIPTKTASLASGFPYDPKLARYGVSEREWNDFSAAAVDAAALPRRAKSSWGWILVRSNVYKRMKRELQYEGGDFKRCLNRWNSMFKQKRFTVSLELPGPLRPRDEDTEEDRLELARQEKLYRIVITPTGERAGSMYSRTSSLTRSVSGEGRIPKTAGEDEEET